MSIKKDLDDEMLTNEEYAGIMEYRFIGMPKIEEEIKTFGESVKDAPELSGASMQILKSYVAAHSTLTERKRAYDLAMWVLASKGNK